MGSCQHPSKLYAVWQLCYSQAMKTQSILGISVAVITLLLVAVAGLMWWQNDFEDRLPIRGDEVEVGLVPADGVYVAGRYYASPGKVEHRGVILLHMAGSNQNAWNNFAAELQDRNFEVMTLDFRGHGESSGVAEELKEADYLQLVDDAAEAVEYLRDIDADMKIAVVGAGLGANVALQLADRDTTITAAGLVSPQHNYRGVKITKMNRSFTRPIYYLVSQTDTVSYAATQTLYQTNPSLNKELRVAAEAEGRGTKLINHAPKLRDAMADWLELVL